MAENTLIIKKSHTKVSILTGSRVLCELRTMTGSRQVNQCFVLSNSTVWNLWGSELKGFLPKDTRICLIPDGERYKNMKTVAGIYDELVRSGATRSTVFIAFGGGVIGDLGGFVASTYHRGVPLIQIPTTLLAQVDSSLGGKTGFNLKSGKNLVGSFYHPVSVISDVGLLGTLPEREYLSGIAEVIKAGLIRDTRLITCLGKERCRLLDREPTTLAGAISRAQAVKIDVVQRDEKESGLRAILNFGHTLAHALEKLMNWKVLHGDAVAVGMGFASYLSHTLGGMSKADHEMVLALINAYGLPLQFNQPAQSLINAFHFDKKRRDDRVEWVLLEKPGKAKHGVKIDEKTLERAIKGYARSFASSKFTSLLPRR